MELTPFLQKLPIGLCRFEIWKLELLFTCPEKWVLILLYFECILLIHSVFENCEKNQLLSLFTFKNIGVKFKSFGLIGTASYYVSYSAVASGTLVDLQRLSPGTQGTLDVCWDNHYMWDLVQWKSPSVL